MTPRECWLRPFVVTAELLVVVASNASCSPRAAETERGERPLEVVVSTEAATLDPRFATRSLDVKITRLVHAGLAGLDPDSLEPVPLVAESWWFVDERTLDVTLRPGVTFHSGRPLRPEDVCATLAAVKNPALGSPHRAVVEAIGSCTPLGARALSIALAHPRATLLSDLEIPILRADEASAPPRPDGALDGLGPFAIARVLPGDVALEPASTGLMARPRHGVVVRTVRDENARVERLLAGRSDIAPNSVSPTLLPELDGHDGLDVVARPGANVTYLLFQNDRAPFTNVAVRRAVAEALDRERLTKWLLAGRATVANSLLPPGHWAYGEVPPVVFSPSEARAVLSGLAPITLLTGADRSRVTLARAMAQMLGDAGLTTNVVPLDVGVLFSRLDAGDFDMAVLQIPELTEPNVLRWFFHPHGVPGEGGEGKNRARYRDAKAGALLDDAALVSDRATRAADYRAFATLFAEDMPVVPLFHEDQVAVVSTRARGFVPSAEGRWLSLARLE
jgi:peptide/nickel transport system substrate-binding protein